MKKKIVETQPPLSEIFQSDFSFKCESKNRAKWESMYARGLESFLLSHSQTFRRRLCRGTSQKFRWDSWKLMLRWTATCKRLTHEQNLSMQHNDNKIPLHEQKSLQPTFKKLDSLFPITFNEYSSLATTKSSFSSLIQIDGPRTLPQLSCFKANEQKQLIRILTAYANYNPIVGYCQGMNFVAAFILLVSNFKEYETYCFFVRFMDAYELKGFFHEQFPLLKVYVEALENSITELFPDLQNHFIREGILPPVYIYQWFLTLFVCALPLPTVVIIWDYILAKGLHSVLQVVLSLLKALSRFLLSLNFEDAVQFLKSLKGTGDCNQTYVGKMLVRQAETMQLPDSVFSKLRLPFFLSNHYDSLLSIKTIKASSNILYTFEREYNSPQVNAHDTNFKDSTETSEN